MLAPETTKQIKLDPVTLLTNASLPVKATVIVLLVASTLVWLITVLKFLQLLRMRWAEADFQSAAMRAQHGGELFDVASAHRGAPGGRVVSWLAMRGAVGSAERMRAVVDRAIVIERQRAGSYLGLLGTIAAVSPFVGLFGTVYGIIDAFIRIGAEKSASLPVVAPAIGEALLATLIGLGAAIPAVVFYNLLDKQLDKLESDLDAAAAEWVLLVAETRR